MTLDYTAWPTSQDVQDRLTAASLTLRDQTGRRMKGATAAVVAEVAQLTKRQFVADTVDTVRYYDGNSTAEIEVDEMISLTSVGVIGVISDPGYTMSDVQLIQEQDLPQTRIITARGSLPNLLGAHPLYFPGGRGNIVVTGKFGYAVEIPIDLWEAVCGEIAYRLGAECVFDPSGRVSSWKEGDEATTYRLSGVDATNWHSIYLSAIGHYKRPAGRRLRNLRNRMT